MINSILELCTTSRKVKILAQLNHPMLIFLVFHKLRMRNIIIPNLQQKGFWIKSIIITSSQQEDKHKTSQENPNSNRTENPQKILLKIQDHQQTLAKNEAAHHVPTLGPGNRDLIPNGKWDQTARTGIRAMAFTMLHVLPRLQSLDRLEVIQTGNEIDGHRPITELPGEIRHQRRREIKIVWRKRIRRRWVQINPRRGRGG